MHLALHPRVRLFLGSSLVAVAALAPFVGTWDYPLFLDDRIAITTNPVVSGEFDVKRIFSTDAWGHQEGYHHLVNYRPIPVLMNAVLAHNLGLKPRPFRILNYALYAVSSILLWLLALRIGIEPLPALMGALVFAVHPIHVETVMFVVNKEELLVGLSALLVVWLLSAREGCASSRIASAVGVAFVAMLCKENAIALPAVLVVWLWVRGGQCRRRVWIACGFSVLAIGIWSAARYAALGRMFAGYIPWQDNPLVLEPLPGRIPDALAVLYEAAQNLVLPLNLSADYSYFVLGLPAKGFDFRAAVGLAIVLLVAGLCWWAWRRRRMACLLGCAVLVFGYLPVSSLVLPSTIILADRTLYLPSLGLAIVLADILSHLKGSLRQVALGAAAIWAVLGLVLAYAQTRNYRTGLELYRASLEARPGSSRLHNNLVLELADQGRLGDAERHCRLALGIDPSNSEAHLNLGSLLASRGELWAAVRHFKAALRYRPGYKKALSGLCRAHVLMGRFEDALGPCEAACARGAPVDDVLELLDAIGACVSPGFPNPSAFNGTRRGSVDKGGNRR